MGNARSAQRVLDALSKQQYFTVCDRENSEQALATLKTAQKYGRWVFVLGRISEIDGHFYAFGDSLDAHNCFSLMSLSYSARFNRISLTAKLPDLATKFYTTTLRLSLNGQGDLVGDLSCVSTHSYASCRRQCDPCIYLVPPTYSKIILR